MDRAPFHALGPDLDEGYVHQLGISHLLGVLGCQPDHQPGHQGKPGVDALDLALWLLGEDVPLLLAEVTPGLPRELRPAVRNIVGSLGRARRCKLPWPLDHEERGELAMLLAQAAVNMPQPKHARSTFPAREACPPLTQALINRHAVLARAEIGELQRGAAFFQELFGLSADEQALCLFSLVMANWTVPRTFFVHVLQALEFRGRRHLQAALGLSAARLEAVLQGRLRQLGVIPKSAFEPLLVDPDFLALITRPQVTSQNAFIPDNSLYQPARPGDPSLDMEALSVSGETLGMMRALLAQAHDTPTHILIYGAPGTGKTVLARALVHGLSDTAFEIGHAEEPGSLSRWTALAVCQARTSAGLGAILLIDEADHLLQAEQEFARAGEVRNAGRLAAFLDQPRVRAVWIAANPEAIPRSILRRFAFSQPLRPPTRRQRIRLWKGILERHQIAGISPDQIRHLAASYSVSPAVMDMAVRQAQKGWEGRTGRA